MADENKKIKNEEPKERSAKKGGKKKKRSKINVTLVVILLAVALLFGIIAGYVFGRRTSGDRLRDAQSQIEELSGEVIESGRNDDVFDEQTNAENEAALNELAGIEAALEGNDLLGGEDLSNLADETTPAEPVVVAEFKGGTVLSDEVADAYEQQIALLAFAGFTEEEVVEESDALISLVLEEIVSNKVLHAKAKELGLDQLSPEDEQEIAKLAQEAYDESVLLAEDEVREDGMSDADVRAKAIQYLEQEEGLTYAAVQQIFTDDFWVEKLYDEAVKDVTVSDADVQAAYDDLLAEQKEAFDSDADSFALAMMNGDVITYYPAGCRAVRELLIPLNDDAITLQAEMMALDPEANASEIAALQEKIDALYAASETKAKEAYQQLQSGTDFAEVARTYGVVDLSNPTDSADTLYVIPEHFDFWPEETVKAAWALQTPGESTAPIRTESGWVLLQYVRDVEAGPVPIESVREELRAILLENAQFEAYSTKVDEWIAEADPKYYPERML